MLPSGEGHFGFSAAQLKRLSDGEPLAAEVKAETSSRRAWVAVHCLAKGRQAPTGLESYEFRVSHIEVERDVLAHYPEVDQRLAKDEITVAETLEDLARKLSQWLPDLAVLGRPSACEFPL